MMQKAMKDESSQVKIGGPAYAAAGAPSERNIVTILRERCRGMKR